MYLGLNETNCRAEESERKKIGRENWGCDWQKDLFVGNLLSASWVSEDGREHLENVNFIV